MHQLTVQGSPSVPGPSRLENEVGMDVALENYAQVEESILGGTTTRRGDAVIVRGEGCWLWDSQGRRYLDLSAAQGVAMLGHCHPALSAAITAQAHTLIACPNFLYNDVRARFAAKLAEVLPPYLPRVFLANSGAEAIDGALKFARLASGRSGIVAATRSFHGRTVGAISMTWEKKYREPFLPLEPLTAFVEYGDLEGLRNAVDKDVAGVFVEPIQGEAGVIFPPEGFLEGVREICDAGGALMIDDEIQTGMGRTGKWLAIQHEGVMPDIVTLAKGMASGFPMGALLAREGLVFHKGEHGSTFAGGPLACAASMATIRVIEQVLPSVAGKGARFAAALADHNPRWKGLMIGLSVGENCAAVQKNCAKNGVLVNCAADGNLRLVPPLVITPDEIDQAAGVIDAALREKKV